MSGPAVSVVIPTYNRARLAFRAIASALAALAPGDEVIVVDDGSTDDTEAVLSSYGDRIRYLRAPHGGAGKARNRGIAEARNPLCAFLDSDDEWQPDRLHLGRRLLGAREDLLFCFSNFALREEGLPDVPNGLRGWHHDGRPWEQILGPGRPYSEIAPLPPGRADFQVYVGSMYAPLLEASYVATQTLLVWRERAGASLRFGEDSTIYSDWFCASRLARIGQAAYLDCETAWQWGHAGPRLTDTDDLQRATTSIKLIQELWAADADYLAREGDRVRRVLEKHHLTRAKFLIRRGQNREAREALKLAGRAPASYRLIAAMPGPLAHGLFEARALVRRTLFSRRELS
jgi:glycosyltransferase involved in cell wall biosynthesis